MTTELTQDELLEELASTEAVEVSMIESAANEIGQMAGVSFDQGFVEERSEFEGTYCLSVASVSEDEVVKDLERLGYSETFDDDDDFDDDDGVRGFVRGRIVAMIQTKDDAVFVYIDYDEDADSELDELEFNDL